MFGDARGLPAHDVELQRVVIWVGYLLRQGILKASRRVEHGLCPLAMKYSGVKSRGTF